MIRNFFLLAILLILGGYLILQFQTTSLEKLGSQTRLEKITEERDRAIKLAVKEGVYQCCIEPPCTMCYLEANQWNNYQPGTCACDQLIAQGKEPCPQCQHGVCETDSQSACETKGGGE